MNSKIIDKKDSGLANYRTVENGIGFNIFDIKTN